MRRLARLDDGRRHDFDRRRRRCSSDGGRVHCFGGLARLSFGGGDGVVNGLLGGDVGRLAATNGGCAGFWLRRLGSDRGCVGDRLCRGYRSALPATGSRRRRCRSLGLSGALLALPSGPDP